MPKLSELKDTAKKLAPPLWATHVAVSNDGSKVEPAVWVEKIEEFLDESPETDRTGYFKKRYWKFFSITELNQKCT